LRDNHPSVEIILLVLIDRTEGVIMNTNFAEMVKGCMECGMTLEEAKSFVLDCMKAMPKTEESNIPQKPTVPTGTKAPRKKKTEEEREAEKKAKTEAWKAEKKAWAEEHYTKEEREAYVAEKKTKREEGKKKHIAYCKTKAFFDGKKVSSAEWHKKCNEFLALAK
jgi:hypothetical protein